MILWTRVSPPEAQADGVEVVWELAADPLFRQTLARGGGVTGPGRDYTLKADPTGLEPGRTYHYRFHALGQTSPAGRTKTLPVGRVESLRLGVASCANYPQGYFNAYRDIAGLVQVIRAGKCRTGAQQELSALVIIGLLRQGNKTLRGLLVVTKRKLSLGFCFVISDLCGAGGTACQQRKAGQQE